MTWTNGQADPTSAWGACGTAPDSAWNPCGVVPPIIDSITPATGVQESTVSVTIRGHLFDPLATVQVSGTLVTPSNVVVVDSETITADLAITLLAAHTLRGVTVTNP